MLSITDQKVAELMGVSVHVEKLHDTIPGLVVGELGGPMYDLVKLVTRTMNETGGVLTNMGYPDLGTFVLEALRDSERAKSKDDTNAEADFVLERVNLFILPLCEVFGPLIYSQFVRAIPAFQDMSIVNGQRTSLNFLSNRSGFDASPLPSYLLFQKGAVLTSRHKHTFRRYLASSISHPSHVSDSHLC